MVTRAKFRVLLGLCAFVLFTLLIAGPGSAQALGLLGAGSKSSGNDVAEIIEQAAQSGVGVIVIDREGNILSPASSTDKPQAAPGEGTSLMKVQEDVNSFRSVLIERLAGLPDAVREVNAVLRASSPDGTIWAYVKVLLLSLLLFGIGMIGEREIFGKRLVKGFVVSRILAEPEGYAQKVPFLVFRFLMGVVGILFSMMVAYAIGFIFYGPIEDSAIQYTATLVNVGYFSVRLIAGVWRMILSPYLAQYRIPHFNDRDARRLHLWLCTVVSLGAFTGLFTSWIEELGLNAELSIFIGLLLNFANMLLNILMVLVNRRAITRALLNGNEFRSSSWPVRFLARGWLPLVIAYLLFAWGELAYDLVLGLEAGVPLLGGAYAILTVVLVVYGVINYMIERGFARARIMRALNMADDEIGSESVDPDAIPQDVLATRNRITTFEGLARRLAGILAFLAGIYAFIWFWNPSTTMMENSLPETTMDVLAILFIGYIAFNVFRIWIDNKIREEQGDEEPAELGDEGGGSSASRLATLLPLFRNFVLIVIVVTVLLIILMELGVNVGPLFAGAGIVGVAVGFGSQSLVRDIFSGAFFLFDDAFRKGEYIEIGDVKGTVENISVRSFQLRHHLGKLHTIPFGEIQVLTNYSRDWVMMKLPLRVTYDTDVDKVRKLVKKLGQQLLNDPVIGEDFIQPLKSQGVIEMQDSAMIIRVKFMTKPGDQWVARKRVYEEIRALFEREGIKFAHREVTVRLAEDGKTQNLTPQQKDAVLAAAEASIEEEDIAEAIGGDDQ